MYSPDCQYYILRQITAFFGSLVPIVVYGIGRELGFSPAGSFFSALLLIVDVLNVMEARCVERCGTFLLLCITCI